MDHILVGVDFSPRSRCARQHAADLARAHTADLILAYACACTGRADHGRRGRSQQLDEACAEHASRGVSAHVELCDQRPSRALAVLADDLDADIVVVGTSDRRGLSRLFHGSTAEATLRAVDRPVLIARGPSPGVNGYRSVLVPIEFGSSSLNVARTALRWTAGGGSVELFHACPPQVLAGSPMAGGPIMRTAHPRVINDVKREGSTMASRLRTERVDVRFEYATGPTRPAILERVASGNYDLTVVRDDGAGRLRRWLAGKLPERLVRQATSSVLVLPAA